MKDIKNFGTVFLLALTIFVSQAKAESSLQTFGPLSSILETNPQSYFEELLNRFNADGASSPSKSFVRGWWSGRCFSHQKRNIPIAAGLFVVGKSVDAGPLFPDKKEIKIVIGKDSNADPNHFDNLNEEKTDEVKAFLDSFAEDVSKARVIDGSLVSHVPRLSREFQVRKDENYLFSQVIALTEDEDEGLDEGDAEFACYFFKKIQPTDS